MSLRTWRRPLLRTKSLLPPDPRHKPRLLWCQKCLLCLKAFATNVKQIYPDISSVPWANLFMDLRLVLLSIFEIIQQSGKPAYEAILAETAKLKEVLAKHQDSLQKDCGTDGKPNFATYTWNGWLVDSIDSMFSMSSFKYRQNYCGLVERHVGNCLVTLSTRKLRTFATWLSLRWRKSGRLWILLRVSQLQTDIDRSYENVYLISGSNMVEHKPTSLHEFLFEMTTRGHHDVYQTFVQVWCRWSNVPCITWLH